MRRRESRKIKRVGETKGSEMIAKGRDRTGGHCKKREREEERNGWGRVSSDGEEMKKRKGKVAGKRMGRT